MNKKKIKERRSDYKFGSIEAIFAFANGLTVYNITKRRSYIFDKSFG